MVWERAFQIDGRTVGDGQPTYIIAEIGSNHDQRLPQALSLIDAAADAGADAAKFQSLRFDRVHHLPSAEAGQQREFARIELKEEWYDPLARRCRDRNLHFLSSVTYLEAVDLLIEVGAPAIKIASAQFDIYPDVIAKAARSGVPLIMSAGLADYGGIERTLRLVQQNGCHRAVLLHCISRYPAGLQAANLRLIGTYRQAFGCLVGYSDHTVGTAVAPAAIALGACVLEKHLTLSRAGTGPDHHFALTPDEFAMMVSQIRSVEVALGSAVKPPLTEEERALRRAFLYKWVAPEPLKPGTPVDPDELILRRAPGGIPQHEVDHLRRHRVRTHIEAGALLQWSQLEYDG